MRKKKLTPEELEAEKMKKIAAAKQAIAKQLMTRKRVCDQVKGEVDKAKAEYARNKQEAMTALENGDELEARRLCSIANIQKAAIERRTKIYMLNLKIMELLGQKQIFLETFEMGTDLNIGNDLINDEDIANLQKQLEKLDMDIEYATTQIGDTTQSAGTNDIFEELKTEMNRKHDLNAVNNLTPDSPIQADPYKENKHF